jgi:hypothetical protein
MLDHQMLRNLRSAASLVANAREVDVSNLTDDEHAKVDELLSQIVGDGRDQLIAHSWDNQVSSSATPAITGSTPTGSASCAPATPPAAPCPGSRQISPSPAPTRP